MSEVALATSDGPARPAWTPGVRARLLLAFFGISAFAVLAAASGIYAFREVGSRLEIVDTRVPPTLNSLELSRSAERVIAAAPALLAATERSRRDELRTDLEAEVTRLNGKLLELKSDAKPGVPLEQIESVVKALTFNLVALDDVVTRRLAANERINALRRRAFETNEDVQRLLAPWLEVTSSQIAAALKEMQSVVPGGRPDAAARLAALLRTQALAQLLQRQISSAVDALAEASTAEQTRRIPVLAFQVRRAMSELEAGAAGLDPRLRNLIVEQVNKLRGLIDGGDSVPDARLQELALIRDGESRLTENASLARQLTGAVDQLAGVAKQDIDAATRDAVSVQRVSTRILYILVASSLLTSVLIVWFYVGGNIVRRLSALSAGTLAIAGGRLDAPVTVEGTDEIAAMARAVEIFRRNAVELEQLLEERRQAAARLEELIAERTRDLRDSLKQQTATAEMLAHSVEELRALGEVSQAVNSTLDLETVLTTIVAKATQLSGTEAGSIYVLEERSRAFHLRATYGLDDAIIAEIGRGQLRLGETTVGRAAEQRKPIQIADIQQDDESMVFDVIVRAGFRSLLVVPLLSVDGAVGALVVRRKQPGEFASGTVELLQTFAAQSVLAIQNARLFAALQEKGRQLEEANTYKSRFLAAASHDLRQPLHALNLFVAELGTNADPTHQSRLVARIEAAVSSMNELFNALLDMAKLEAGLLEANISAFPVQHLLARLESTFADAAADKGLKLTIVPSRAWIRSDFILLERILLNLVSNAVRYTVHGRVLVGCRRRGEHLRIDVCDTGPGIPETQRDKIFGEFYQVAGPEKNPRGGLGLGLSIVERLGRLLDQPIEMDSRLDKGSRFSISVPITRTGSNAEINIAAPAIPAGLALDKRIVVIDDDPLVLDGMRGILTSWGCRVVTAGSAASALARLAEIEGRPDLIISDFRLGGTQTGINAITQVRSSVGESVPAFLISGDTTPERQRDARAHGLTLLHKPVPPLRLRAALNQLLRGPTRAAAQPTPTPGDGEQRPALPPQ